MPRYNLCSLSSDILARILREGLETYFEEQDTDHRDALIAAQLSKQDLTERHFLAECYEVYFHAGWLLMADEHAWHRCQEEYLASIYDPTDNIVIIQTEKEEHSSDAKRLERDMGKMQQKQVDCAAACRKHETEIAAACATVAVSGAKISAVTKLVASILLQAKRGPAVYGL